MLFRSRFWPGLLTLLLLPVLVTWGCSSTTEPTGGGEVRVVYSPALQYLEVETAQGADFKASPSATASFSARWFLDHQEVGTGENYRYEATFVGDDTLMVETTLDGEVREHLWRITVVPSPSLLPPEVLSTSIAHGPEAMDVILNWQYITGSTFPVVSYQVKGSYEGPVTAETWDDAALLGTYTPRAGFAGHRDTLTAAEDGMREREIIWIAVRGVDDHGQMSPVADFPEHEISFPWYLEGTILDIDGQVVPEAIIRFCDDQQGEACLTNSDAQGFFRIGPFPSVEGITLRTSTSNIEQSQPPFRAWYDFQSDPVFHNEAGNVHDVVLIPRYPAGLDMGFLTLFRFMTWTDSFTALRPNQRLYRWEEYPLKVYIPDFVREEDGLDFGASAREVLGWWNELLGEDYLVEETDEAACDIRIFFADLGPTANGRATLELPDDEPYLFGEVVPRRVLSGINSVILPSVQRVQETVMHELGHCMGLYDHIPGATGDEYLMATTAAHSLDDGYLHAVHPDELRMIRAIRHLPQGVDMAGFRLDDLLP